MKQRSDHEAYVGVDGGVRALRKSPRVALTIDTQDRWPPRALLIRGAARVEHIEASRKVIPAEHFDGWEQGVRALYDGMVPKAVEDLMQAR